MDRFENHNNKIDLKDKYNIKDIEIDKGFLYNGDYELFNQINNNEECHKYKPLAASVLGINNTDIPLPEDVEFFNCWTDADAQEAYLKQEPKTYLILGKNGIGCYTLGEALTKKLNCIHICPKTVLLDEIEQKSLSGKCLEFNMRHNKVCKFDIILKIMKEKLKSPAVVHRGFVMSELPMVTSLDQNLYFSDTLISEEALNISQDILEDLVYSFKKKKSRKVISSHSSVSSKPESLVEEEAEEEQEIENETVADQEEDQIVELPKFYLNTCKDLPFHTKPNCKTLNVILLDQIQDIFNFKPDIIISVSCPDKDVITKRGCKYINYLNNSNTFKPFECHTDNEIKWPPHYILIDFVKPYDAHTFNPKYNCKQPNNFSSVVTQQLCNYKLFLTPFIEKKLKSYSSKNLIKLDGRVSAQQMSYICFERLLIMSIKPVLIPEPLYLDEPPEDFEELWRSIEQLNVLHSGVLSFNRYASFWYNRCPVELRKRRSIHGNAKFAVTFFKHVYLLSSLQAMVDFCRNPRPFLKLEYLEPTCRVIIMGTQSSGKTMVSKCLSWLFSAPIISYVSFSEEIRRQKYLSYSQNILIEIRSNIEDARLNDWQNKELERVSKLNTWFNTVSSRLATYLPILKKKLALPEDEPLEDKVLIKKFETLRSQLQFLPINDLDACKEISMNNNLLKFAPADLITQISKPGIPLLGDEDVTRAITAYIASNELEKEIEPTVSEFTSQLVTILQNIDSNSLNSSDSVYGKFIIDGFPSDSEYWTFLAESGFLPDYTIALVENREIDVDLLQHYNNIEKGLKNYQERYTSASDPLIKIKLCQDIPSNTSWLDMQIIVDQFITNTFDLIFQNEETIVTEANNETSVLALVSEKIEKFRENWDIVKQQLEGNFKSIIEVELEDKSDIDVIEEVLQKIRKGYCKPLEIEEDASDIREDENESVDDVSYNDPNYLGETNIYCPVAFYDYGILWEGKTEFVSKYFNKNYYSSNENTFKLLQNDITKYQCYNRPLKKIPPLRICVIGSIASGKSTLSKIIAKELGLFHIDFDKFINNILIPKHFKRVGWQYENNFTYPDMDTDIEDVDDLQTEENLNDMSDILFKERELTRMVKNYFEQGSSLPSVFITRLIKKLWFESPYTEAGLVIDGFPKLPSDVEDMINNYCIPDLILELECDLEIAIERISPELHKKWKLQLKEAKRKVDKALEVERNAWKNFITRKIVIELIIGEILEDVIVNEEPLKTLSEQSTIIDADPTGSSNVDAHLFATYNELIQEYPEPVDLTEWEKSDDALERINNRIESIYQVQDENVQSLKDVIDEQKLKMESFNGKKGITIVTRRVLEKLSKLRNRSDSFLEQTFTISCDIAEILILEGFFLLSKFNRMCPVFIKDNPYTLFNPYSVNKVKNSVFPVIHRAYIYFISSKDNVKKFRKNPWEYVKENIIQLYISYPLSISVIGPPKSGKSELASKLAKRYGLICISRGMAVRYIMENLRWTYLGLKISSLLNAGHCIDNNFLMKAVVTVAMIDNRTMSNGIILDGIPDSPFEVCELSKQGLFPLVIFDLKSTNQTVLTNSQNEIYNSILKFKPPYCRPLIDFKFVNWEKNSKLVRNWINDDTQNLYDINGNNSKWQCFADAINVIEELIPKVHHYLTFEKSEIVRVGFMAVSNKIFEQKMSHFKNLCPICFKKNTLRHSGFPPNKKGLVQYKNRLYWICSEHIDFALKYPEEVLITNKIIIPEIPAPVLFVDMSIVYENGTCIVTYADNLPSQKIAKGLSEFAALYKKKIYLFCSSECHLKFLAKPHIYYDIKVFKEMNIFPRLTLKDMPHIGYLEQSIGNIITEACCAINAARPKYPGLDIRLSGLLYLALFLKNHNKALKKDFIPIYKRIFKIFEARCKLITDISLRLRSANNPFADYPNCCKNIKWKQLEGNARISDSVLTTIYSDADFSNIEQ